jgi:3D (Asp-Asp-Asp) domain-containing protein
MRSRFVSEDPIGLAGGLNRYAYVFNGPVSNVDPFGLRKVLMTVTGYDNGVGSTGKNPGDPGYGITSTGKVAAPGTIAADKWWYPSGTQMDIPGYGPGVVQDTGGAFRGKPDRIDIWFPSREAAKKWGRRTLEVDVHDEMDLMPTTPPPVPDVLRDNVLGRRKPPQEWPQFPAPWAP